MIDVEKMTPNRSKTYLLPLLYQYIDFDKVSKHFINCFIFDSVNLHDESIYLLYRYDLKDPEMTHFEHEISKIEGYQKHYDLKNNLILFVLKFPTEYLREYYAYINGNYSEFGEDGKKTILKYLALKTNSKFASRIKKIFDKDNEIREELEKKLGVKLDPDCEVGSIMDEENETIDIKGNIVNYI